MGYVVYDAVKKINRRKRHAFVNIDGRSLALEPHPASIQDRDGGGPLLHLAHSWGDAINTVLPAAPL